MIYLASDHAGLELKKGIASFLQQASIAFFDMGPYEYDTADDYPDFVIPAAEKVAQNPVRNRAIIIGGSGQGEAIAANKVGGVRAAVYYGGSKKIVALSRLHNNTNVLSLGARFIGKKEAVEMIKLWLKTDFSGETRHGRRIKKISNFEKG